MKNKSLIHYHNQGLRTNYAGNKTLADAAAWILLSALVLLLAALSVLSVLAGQAGYSNLLMVTPNTFGVPEISAEKLDEFSADEFLLTYEIRRPATAQAVNSRHSAALVGTNHNYAGIMGYVLLDGGFFTKTAVDSKNKHVVLNKTAAFQMFGSSHINGSVLKLNGEAWIITGVIQDNDKENANLYVPASVNGGRADSVIVLLGGAVTEAYAKNALKSIGIHDNGYDFINLSKSAEAFSGRFSVAWKAAMSSFILLFILAAGGKLLKKTSFYREQMRELYLRELVAHNRKDLLKTICGLVAFIAGIVAVFMLSLQILETCLTWQELARITGELTAGDFGQKLLWLRDYQILGDILFWGCICVVAFGFILVLFRRPY